MRCRQRLERNERGETVQDKGKKLPRVYLNNCASHIAIVLLFDHANAFTSKCVWTSSKMAEVSDK